MVAMWRLRSSAELKPNSNGMRRATDAEIDMHRIAPRPSLLAQNFSRLLRWMLPKNTMAPPKRSVAREIEEAFPSRDD